jgi:hypothetical protein
MYGGGGHVLDAINRLKGNRSQLANSRRRRDRLKERYIQLLKTGDYGLSNEKIPKEVLEKIKAEIRADIKRKYLIQMTLTWLVFIGFVAFVFWMVMG